MNGDQQILDSREEGTTLLELCRDSEGRCFCRRKVGRSGIVNLIGQYAKVDSAGKVFMKAIDESSGQRILERFSSGEPFSACFLFPEKGVVLSEEFMASLRVKSPMEKAFTSTGAKFWKHPESMLSYRLGTGRSVVSTHISPEGRCNLACPYCSVSYRRRSSRLSLDTIKRYVCDLQSRGLKAVIITGGGEPTLYPEFDEMLDFIYSRGLEAALITNGTNLYSVSRALLSRLTWMRVSVNIFPSWEERISVPDGLGDELTLGMSFIYTPLHQVGDFELGDVLGKIKIMADRFGVRYVRLLPNCLHDTQSLLVEHLALSRVLEELDDERFFHQGKLHESPRAEICHQSFFRPYLSEEPFPGEEEGGSVFPCDSLVLNRDLEHFGKKYLLCRPAEVLDYLDRRIEARFMPKNDCTGCVFSGTVNMLEEFMSNEEDRFREFEDVELNHVNFI